MIIENLLFGNVFVIGVDEADLDSSTSVRVIGNEDLDCTIWPVAVNDLSSEVFVMYGGYGDLISVVGVREYVDLPSSISIPYHNVLWGTVDILKPPYITDICFPTQDAFVRENIPTLNYGFTQDMIVGRSGGGEHLKGLLQFDISHIVPNRIIFQAELVLTLWNEFPRDNTFKILDSNFPWVEGSVTWSNCPSGVFVKNFYSGKKEHTITVDVTDLVIKWYTGENHGCILQAINENLTKIAYYTRESLYPPVLRVKHYDLADLMSADKSTLSGSLMIAPKRSSDLGSLVEIINFDFINTRDIECSITVPFINDEADLFCSVDIKNHHTEDLDGSISVKRTEDVSLPSSLEVWYKSILPSSIRIKALGNDDLSGDISVKVTADSDLLSDLAVWFGDFIPASIIPRAHGGAELEGSITIRLEGSSDLDGFVNVYSVDDVNGEITVRTVIEVYLPSEATVRRSVDDDLSSYLAVYLGSYLDGEITVKALGSDNLDSEITVRQNVNEDLSSSIDIYTVADLGGELYVKALGSNDLEGSISVRQSESSDIPSSLAGVLSAYLDSEIIVLRRNLPSEITVRVSSYEYLNSSIIVRVEEGNSLSSEIIVREQSEKDLDSEINVYQHSDLESSLTVPPTSDLPSSIWPRLYSDLAAWIHPKAWGDADLNSIVSSRIVNISERDSLLLVRLSDDDDIICTANVFQVSDIDGFIWPYLISEIPSSLIPRIVMISEIDSYVEVNRIGGAYAFIM